MKKKYNIDDLLKEASTIKDEVKYLEFVLRGIDIEKGFYFLGNPSPSRFKIISEIDDAGYIVDKLRLETKIYPNKIYHTLSTGSGAFIAFSSEPLIDPRY